MAGNRLDMKDIEEIRRLLKLGLTNRQIARASGGKIHRNTVNKYALEITAESSISSEGAALPAVESVISWPDSLDWEKVRTEYLRGVPLNILHDELFETGKVPVQYPGFWKQAQKRIALTEATMVRIFKPGERIEIDYADGIDILDPTTGEIKKTELYVGVLCHSRYAFAEFTWTQSSQDFLQSHVNMFNYFGGTAQVLSPDNLKSAVTKVHRYDPVINQSYSRLAAHYEVAVVPARVKTPKDKAIVERTIQIFQRWFFMKVRHRTFTSLLELNQCLREHLVLFNKKQHRIFKLTREEMFAQERPHLKSLPQDQYKVAIHRRATLSRDCHLIFEYNFYSAPHQHRGKELDVWATALTVEIYHEAERLAVHARRKGHSQFATEKSHYPPAQQAYAEEDFQKVLYRATRVGPNCEKLIKELLNSKYPLQHFRRAQGILALVIDYGSSALENACQVANLFEVRNVQYLERVIKTRGGRQVANDNKVGARSENPFLRGINNIH
jgi:hypothetical protein